MTVRLARDGTVELHGVCPIEDAQTLHEHLLSVPDSPVDWRACSQAHTAVIQVLMASGAVLRGPPAGELLCMWLDPAMKPG